MKVKMSLLKKIIRESVLLENLNEPNPYIKTLINLNAVSASTAMKGLDNPEALAIMPEDRKRLEVTLRVQPGSKYYGKTHFIWSGSKVGAPDMFYLIGSFTNGNGDPFTYEKVSGNKYRVISGPVSKTIGKTFSLNPAPAVPVKLPPDEGETILTREEDESSLLDSPVSEIFKQAADKFKSVGMTDLTRVIEIWPMTNGTFGKGLTLRQYLKRLDSLIDQSMRTGTPAAKAFQGGKRQGPPPAIPTNLIVAYAEGDKDAIKDYIMNEILIDYTDQIEAELE